MTERSKKKYIYLLIALNTEMSASVKVGTPGSSPAYSAAAASKPYSPMVRPSVRSPKSTPTASQRTPLTGGVKANQRGSAEPRGGGGGQRFRPETPKSTPTAVPPIYANVHSQLSSGNNRQMSPQIAKILEDGGKKENGGGHPRDPPAVPKPAARMSLRHKVKT